jgi:transcriptional regulator with XRE-family HTH domain
MFRPNRELGAIIAWHRRARDLSQAELADRAGVGDQSVVSRWERGRTRPDPETLALLVRELGIAVCDILADEMVSRVNQPSLIPVEVREALVKRSKQPYVASPVVERLKELARLVTAGGLTVDEACGRAVAMSKETGISHEDSQKIGQWIGENCQTHEDGIRVDREDPATL